MDANYRAYLLRFQRGDPQSNWRVTLENVHTGEVLHFSSENKLLRYLIRSLQKNNEEPHRDPLPKNEVI